MINWGEPEPDGPEVGYAREVAEFLALHLDSGPAVLWPRQDHRALGDHDPGRLARSLAELAHELGGLTDRQVVAERPAGNPGAGAHGWADDHLFVQQTAGSSTWNIEHESQLAVPVSVRLLPGEALYIPAGSGYTVACNSRSRQLRFAIGAARGPSYGRLCQQVVS